MVVYAESTKKHIKDKAQNQHDGDEPYKGDHEHSKYAPRQFLKVELAGLVLGIRSWREIGVISH